MRTMAGFRGFARSLLVTSLVMTWGAAAARGQEVDVDALDDIVDRNYRIDLYQGSVLGSGRIVGMGGAAVAMAEGSAGTAANPASPAVRPATSRDKWDWDWHVDWLSPELGSDFDNNGISTTEELEVSPFITVGLVGRYKHWAVGASFDFSRHRVGLPADPDTVAVTPSFIVGRLVLSRTFARDELTVGLGVRAGTFEILRTYCPTAIDDCPVAQQSESRLFELTGSALETGAVWRPPDRNLRVGATLSLPVAGRTVKVDACSDPAQCGGYIVPGEVEVPWRVAAGVAWRRGPTLWNRKIASEWRDERSLMLAADLVVTGAVDDGFGIEAFVDKKLQPSGRKVVLSLRGGAEYEWKPGRLRVRGGSYWEPGRFLTHTGATIGGRLHVTAGLDYRFYTFCFWGDRYRARVSLISDAAERYFNGGLSVGLWH